MTPRELIVLFVEREWDLDLPIYIATPDGAAEFSLFAARKERDRVVLAYDCAEAYEP